jgi:hypothetical protein
MLTRIAASDCCQSAAICSLSPLARPCDRGYRDGRCGKAIDSYAQRVFSAHDENR